MVILEELGRKAVITNLIAELKTLLFWVEEQHTDKKKLEVTRKRVKEIREKYEKRFVVINVDADIQTYPL